MNSKIKDIINKIILILKEEYPDLEVLNRFNKTLNIYEFVIKDTKYYSNEGLDDFLDELMEEYVYCNKLHIYCYYLQENEFEELKKEDIINNKKKEHLARESAVRYSFRLLVFNVINYYNIYYNKSQLTIYFIDIFKLKCYNLYK